MKEKYYRVAKSISRWKLDNCFENWLGNLADKSEFFKYIYVLYYRLFDWTYYKNGLPALLKQIEHQHEIGTDTRLSDSKLKTDMIYSLHRFGASFVEYFVYKFYNLNSIGRERFVTLKMHYGYCELVNKDGIRKFFDDKYECYTLFKQFYKREVVTGKENNRDELESFVLRHNSFICKPIVGQNGKGIKLFREVDSKDVSELVGKLLMEHSDGVVLEELIIQAPEMALLHKESINTVRIVSFRTKDTVDIIGAGLRMGAGGAVVDNAGSGGIYASVDIHEGIVISLARAKFNNNQYMRHPDTKILIPGFRIPQWEDAISFVRQMANVVDGATVIAWDIAYSVNGWCMVEANDVGDFNLFQAPIQTGFKDKIVKELNTFFEYK